MNHSKIDILMALASEALAKMDYLSCNAKCEEAFRQAKNDENWPACCRILLPMQECRRQRRLTASQGLTRLGTTQLQGDIGQWLKTMHQGCIVVTFPHDASIAQELQKTAAIQQLNIEVLWAVVSPTHWTVASFNDPTICCKIAPPPAAWVDCWIDPTQGLPSIDDTLKADHKSSSCENEVATWPSPAAWFLHAYEKLGDAALAQVPIDSQTKSRALAELEKCLTIAPDHENIIQQLIGETRQKMLQQRID